MKEMFESIYITSVNIANDGEDSKQLGIILQEETFTEMALLRMLKYQEELLKSKRISKKYLAVKTHGKRQENKTGVDFEWWIYFKHEKKWIALFFQAKKYFCRSSPKSKRIGANVMYPSDPNQTQQWKKLTQHAYNKRAIPLYCFYNPASVVNCSSYGWTYKEAELIGDVVKRAQKLKLVKSAYVNSAAFEPLWSLFLNQPNNKSGPNGPGPNGPNNYIDTFLGRLEGRIYTGKQKNDFLHSELEVPNYVKVVQKNLREEVENEEEFENESNRNSIEFQSPMIIVSEVGE